MRLPRLAIYLALGFAFASLLQLVFGAGGVLEYGASARHRTLLEQNIEELKRANLQLLGELEALRSDPELLRLQARELGYFRENEYVIRVEGSSPPKNSYAVGRLILRASPPPKSPWYFRAAGLGLPALLLLGRTIRLLRRPRPEGSRPGGVRLGGRANDAPAV